MEVLRVGSRKSQLAMIQTNCVVDELQRMHPNIRFEIVTMATIGDKVLDKALPKIGQTNLFTKELEVALAAGSVDFVVHSLKDLPSALPEGLAIAAIGKRELSADAVLMCPQYRNKTLSELPPNSVIGTSSLRRIAQLKRHYPHLAFENVRGNLNTRLKKLDEDEKYQALVLAAAGVSRMGWQHRIDQLLTPDECLYAVGQGALGIEIRRKDTKTLSYVSDYNDYSSYICNAAERAFLHFLDKGCSVPIGVHAELKENKLMMTGAVFSLDGSQCVKHSSELLLSDSHVEETDSEEYESLSAIVCCKNNRNSLRMAETFGRHIAEIILSKNGGDILAEARQCMKNDDY